MSASRSSHSGGSDSRLPRAGQFLKNRALGTEAFYRVVGKNARGVEVEVVDAPGLLPGARFTFSEEAVLSMDALDSLWDELGRS